MENNDHSVGEADKDLIEEQQEAYQAHLKCSSVKNVKLLKNEPELEDDYYERSKESRRYQCFGDGVKEAVEQVLLVAVLSLLLLMLSLLLNVLLFVQWSGR